MNNKSDKIIVSLKCIRHAYTGGGSVSTGGLPFTITRGQRVAVLGPNGSGKSTLLKHILGLLEPTEGTVEVLGVNPASQYMKIRSRIGAVMQNTDEQLIGPTVLDDVAFAPLNFGCSASETYRKAIDILKRLNIYELKDRLPHYLSGGERRKVALAGALILEPDLLVMDEPLEGIDHASRREISNFLQRLHAETEVTMISTTHDMNIVSDLADCGYVMNQSGGLEIYGTIEELFFNHDLHSFNLAPPATVRIIKGLRRHGLEIAPTLSAEVLSNRLLELLHPEIR
ncbi:MAG: ATP-binding cassette domain-containing protein [bacterium]|jgi:cobalt/nickel transport system ATP-binding protein|nr:ATP-binding cassette domain-containing protein [bacterium]MDD4152823.1 ATP-binding cassette domain-containing protein [bacterium]